jgi:hypothetical protein
MVLAGRKKAAANYWQGVRDVSTLGLPRLLSIAPTDIVLSGEPFRGSAILAETLGIVPIITRRLRFADKRDAIIRNRSSRNAARIATNTCSDRQHRPHLSEWRRWERPDTIKMMQGKWPGLCGVL